MFRRHRSAAGWIAIFTIAAVLPALCDTDAAALFASIWVLPDPVPVLALLPIAAPAGTLIRFTPSRLSRAAAFLLA